jgi:hypothetical protein
MAASWHPPCHTFPPASNAIGSRGPAALQRGGRASTVDPPERAGGAPRMRARACVCVCVGEYVRVIMCVRSCVRATLPHLLRGPQPRLLLRLLILAPLLCVCVCARARACLCVCVCACVFSLPSLPHATGSKELRRGGCGPSRLRARGAQTCAPAGANAKRVPAGLERNRAERPCCTRQAPQRCGPAGASARHVCQCECVGVRGCACACVGVRACVRACVRARE